MGHGTSMDTKTTRKTTTTTTMKMKSERRRSFLLTSYLSDDVMADRILVFLDRNSVMMLLHEKCLAPFRDHFHLSNYYCSRHGTKFEQRDLERESNEEAVENAEEEDGDDDGDDDGNNDGNDSDSDNGNTLARRNVLRLIAARVEREEWESNEEAIENAEEDVAAGDDVVDNEVTEVRCIDCVEEESVNFRCEECEKFEGEFGFLECYHCEITRCENCHHYSDEWGVCVRCERQSCGRQNSSNINDCPRI